MTKYTNTLNIYDLATGVFIRGLGNLKNQLVKAENCISTKGSCAKELLGAQLAINESAFGTDHAPADLHMYSLAAQVHWAAEGARLAVNRLMGAQPVPIKSNETNFTDLYQYLDKTIGYIKGVAPGKMKLSLHQVIVIEHPVGSINISGNQFLFAYAIPHFFYHLTAAYSILRSQQVPLTMEDYLGDWAEY